MKKITRSILISGIVILSSCTTNEMKNCCKRTVQEVYEYEGLTVSSCNSMDEVANTAEDMIEWINHDVGSGYLDSTTADSYIENLEQIINEVR